MTAWFLIDIRDNVGGFLHRRLHLSNVGFDEDLEYVVCGHCRWIGIVEPIVELAFFHSGITTSIFMLSHHMSAGQGLFL